MSRYIQNWSWKRKIGVPLLIIIAILGTVGRGPFLSMVSYTTAYEGAKGKFVGVTYNNKFYTKDATQGASIATFDSSMNFDPDHQTKFMPNIMGEMTSVFIPVQEAIPPDWVPSSWWRSSQYTINPVESWTWTITGTDGWPHLYEMEHWVTKWYVSYEAKFDSGPAYWDDEDEAQDRFYHDTQTWIELDISPVWQFEGQDFSYFAIGKIELDNIKFGGVDQQGREVEPRPGIDVTPESVGGILTIYTSLDNLTKYDEGDITTYAYRETKLNPQYFRDKVYVHIDLNDFGVKQEGGIAGIITGLEASGDVVTMGFTVHQFVVGEWIQKDVSTIQEDEFGRQSQTKTAWGLLTPLANVFGGIAEFFSTPEGLFSGMAVIMLFVALVVAIVLGKVPAININKGEGK